MRWMVLGAALAFAAAGGAAADGYKAPRNRLGQPDLSGVWTNTSITWLQRPPGVKALAMSDAEAEAMSQQFRQMVDVLIRPTSDPDAPAPEETKAVDNSDFLEMDLKPARVNGQWRSSWIVEPQDGRLPFTEEGRARTRERGRSKGYDSYEMRPTDERCLTAIGSPEGPPMMNTGFNGHYQILQTKDHVAILVEMNHDVRIVTLIAGPEARRPRTDPKAPRWMGESVGWFEGGQPGDRDHQPQSAGRLCRQHDRRHDLHADRRRAGAADADRAGRDPVRLHGGGPGHLRAPVASRDAVAAGDGPDLRIRLPRGQLFADQHPGRGPGRGGRREELGLAPGPRPAQAGRRHVWEGT
ncbi:hypothetical protein LRS10_01925 [Phenylobacterium sp. J426]|uniref:hypothetical protein n=1 Tax=Phenylobacterium sp. J426 TaxID=2898439 RepID=UPI002151C608|nr:hypothetical protein [Phenylobacterium sp. J426]MCR5873061.1 hypothetical protein [Phenylobacterium sp. J426]